MIASLLRRLRARVMSADAEPDDYPFSAAEQARLLDVTGAERSASDALDEPTWRDLLLERYLDGLGAGVSIFGRQVLYRRLRAGIDDDEAGLRCDRIGRLLDDPAGLEALRRRLACLRRADVEVAELLFEAAPPFRPWWIGHLLWLPVLLAASILAALLVTPWGWAGTFGVMACLVSVRQRYQDRIGPWVRSMRALQMVLRACSLLDGSGLPFTDDFRGRGGPAGRLNRALARSPLADTIPDAAEYANWFLSAEVRHYFRTAALVFARRDFLRDCCRLCAELEADVALARHLRASPAWCWAERGGQRTLRIDGGVHPLLDAAAPLSIDLDGRGAFLSGQNGAGKSTLLRMLGLNLAVARGFGFAYARAAALPAIPVVASMQNEDSLLGGQSLYVAELARARALLAAASARPVVCLIDEVFRGTNHEEAVSAAAAVVEALARDALVVVSSHNLVLGTVLAGDLVPWRVVRTQAGSLRLEPGVLGRTNGVALLAEHGFDAGVQRRAEAVAGWLAGRRQEGSVTLPAALEQTVIPAQAGI